eukprot:TRINITY_DN32437_c0_g1_i1.p1 TRINITY_DN32437_c0_g1~~TRINITY_DN32437_c0_g1_i1.p1  ORF type:complete len:554 (-),score=77.31 TRINITY_DN32437_c0_g1_i1:204-1865(-)
MSDLPVQSDLEELLGTDLQPKEPRTVGRVLATIAGLGFVGAAAAFVVFSGSWPGLLHGSPRRSVTELLSLNPSGTAGQVHVWTTAPSLGVWQHSTYELPTEEFDLVGPMVEVWPKTHMQEILGFGGAFTEASAVVFQRLDKEQQQLFIERYYSEEGLGYTMGRVHINSCDFSESSYSFDDTKNDWDLKDFDWSLSRDSKALIPLINRAMRRVEEQGQKLKLLASPWSPPAWMKTNHHMVHSGGPGLRPECQGVWARYISNWIKAYHNKSIPIWALTVQNEPLANSNWEACRFSPEEEATFVGHHLGPTIKHDFPNLKLFAYDHNKDKLELFGGTVASHKLAGKYVDGIAFHWYAGDGFDQVVQMRQHFPELFLLATEATYERYRFASGHTKPYFDWYFGPGYAHDILGDLNSGANGWMDWNLVLDTEGGPNHAKNTCDAPMIADTDNQKVWLHPQYWYIGHFSKWLVPGSRRVASWVHDSWQYDGPPRGYGTCDSRDGLETTAAVRPSGEVVVVVLNCGSETQNFKIRVAGVTPALGCTVPPQGIQTYVFPKA